MSSTAWPISCLIGLTAQVLSKSTAICSARTLRAPRYAFVAVIRRSLDFSGSKGDFA